MSLLKHALFIDLFEAQTPQQTFKVIYAAWDRESAKKDRYARKMHKVRELLDRADEKGLSSTSEYKEMDKRLNDQADKDTLAAFRDSKDAIRLVIQRIPRPIDVKWFPKTAMYAKKMLSNKDAVIKYFLKQLQSGELDANEKRDIMREMNNVRKAGFNYPELNAIERSITGKVKDRTPPPKQLKLKFEAEIYKLMGRYGLLEGI